LGVLASTGTDRNRVPWTSRSCVISNPEVAPLQWSVTTRSLETPARRRLKGAWTGPRNQRRLLCRCLRLLPFNLARRKPRRSDYGRQYSSSAADG
jgi:hypothetical protein